MTKRKTDYLGVRLPAAEGREIRRIAEARGLSAGELVRQAVGVITSPTLLMLDPDEATMALLRATGERAAAAVPELACAVERLRALGQAEPAAQLAAVTVVQRFAAGEMYGPDTVTEVAGRVLGRLLESAGLPDLAEQAREEVRQELAGTKSASLH